MGKRFGALRRVAAAGRSTALPDPDIAAARPTGERRWRAPGRDAMLPNLCVGLGNRGEGDPAPLLRRCLADDSELVREHAAWALGRLDESPPRTGGQPRGTSR